MITWRRGLLGLALGAGVVAAGYWAWRVAPLLTTNDDSADKVVLLHGLGRSEMAMLLLESELTRTGFNVYNIGYPSRKQAPDELVAFVGEAIDACCRDSRQRVHFVGHSLGALLIRAYLAAEHPANLGRVVLLGPPNGGTELADGDAQDPISSELLARAGPAARTLHTGPDSFASSLPPPTYPVGIIAGTRDNLLSNRWLPVPNDGMVSLDSTRLDGMTDFITFDVSHWELRNDRAVAAQVVEFLLNGAFAQSGRATDP